MFFPRGRVTHSSTLDDTRGAPPAEAVTDGVRALLEAEAVRRVSSAPRFDLAALDTGLAGPAIPSVERAPAKALVPVPRGSSRPLPEGEVLRLFPHWTQPAKVRVELGLSVAPYDEGRAFVGVCDCTRRPARTRSRWSGRRSRVKSGEVRRSQATDCGATCAGRKTDVAFAARVRAADPPERRRPAEDPDGLAAEAARRGTCRSPWCTVSPRRARADPCTGCRPARSTAAG